MTREDILVEFEAHWAARGEKVKTCPYCQVQTYQKMCPQCDISLSGNEKVDDLQARFESGETPDIESFLGIERQEQKPDDDEFETLNPGELS